MDFTVTDKNFGPDRGGATVGLESVINFATVSGYAAFGPSGPNGPAGLSFLIFHEMAHMTVPGQEFYAQQFAAYRASRPGIAEGLLRSEFDGDFIEFRRTEQFANIAAISIMASQGLATPPEIHPTGPQRRTNQNFPVFGLEVE